MKRFTAILASILMVAALASPALAGGGDCGPSCYNTGNPEAKAAPIFQSMGGGPQGSYFTHAEGVASTDAYVQGSSWTKSLVGAGGTASGDGGGFKIDTPNFKLGAIGAYSKIEVEGEGFGYGVDKYYSDRTDYAEVNIYLSGKVFQSTQGFVGTPVNGFMGEQYSAAGFVAYDWDVDYGTYRGVDSWDKTAWAEDDASAGALVAGGSAGINVNAPNFAFGGAVTANFATWDTDGVPYAYGGVDGAGIAAFGATSLNGRGFAGGTATFCYEGYNNGAGIAAVGGYTKTTYGNNSMTVQSQSGAFSASRVDGGFID